MGNELGTLNAPSRRAALPPTELPDSVSCYESKEVRDAVVCFQKTPMVTSAYANEYRQIHRRGDIDKPCYAMYATGEQQMYICTGENRVNGALIHLITEHPHPRTGASNAAAADPYATA